MNQYLFQNHKGKRLSPEEVVREIIKYMRADEKRAYKVIIGTDSEQLKNNQADFVTAVVIQRVGNGGRYFWRRTHLDKMHILRNRIWQEVIISLDIAKNFLNFTKYVNMPEFDFEIHVDIGENGKTREMIQELTAMVRASNFEPKTKPYSYAASSVADRHNSKAI